MHPSNLAATNPQSPIAAQSVAHHDESPRAWFESGAQAARERGAGTASARNLILFIGDGMGPITVAAARILEGQRRGGPGEEHLLAFEHFPHVAFAKTYNTDLQTPDSAGTMTAIVTGVKTRAGLIGLDSRATLGVCADTDAARLPSLLELAERAGLATGIVTTTRVTHATPAATYAKAADRNWEADSLVPEADRARCPDIARQLVEFAVGDGIEVVMGGGRQMLLPSTQADPEYPEVRGLRADGRDLIAEWQARYPTGRYLWNLADFEALDFAQVDKVLALFQPGHLHYEHDRPGDAAGEPSLAAMVRAAIRRLERAPKGYLLIVEGGRIDHAHHAGNAYRALTDTIALADAVRAATELTSAEDTLIVVTADHSHVLSFAGYSRRGNPILGKVTDRYGNADVRFALDGVGREYTTLSYANGPGYAGASDTQPEGVKRYPHEASRFWPAQGGRPDLRGIDTTDPNFLQPALLPLASETHGGEDVGVYALGPGADAVRGVMEQHVIFHILLQANPALRAQAQHAGPRP
jgi:alkaline phosphatase